MRCVNLQGTSDAKLSRSKRIEKVDMNDKLSDLYIF